MGNRTKRTHFGAIEQWATATSPEPDTKATNEKGAGHQGEELKEDPILACSFKDIAVAVGLQKVHPRGGDKNVQL